MNHSSFPSITLSWFGFLHVENPRTHTRTFKILDLITRQWRNSFFVWSMLKENFNSSSYLFVGHIKFNNGYIIFARINSFSLNTLSRDRLIRNKIIGYKFYHHYLGNRKPLLKSYFKGIQGDEGNPGPYVHLGTCTIIFITLTYKNDQIFYLSHSYNIRHTRKNMNPYTWHSNFDKQC